MKKERRKKNLQFWFVDVLKKLMNGVIRKTTNDTTHNKYNTTHRCEHKTVDLP